MIKEGPVLAYDLGGTKVAVGIVTPQGKVREEIRVPVEIKAGKSAVIRQLTDLGQHFLKRYPQIKTVGIASAGPLDPRSGDLLDPTNFRSKAGKNFGRIALGKLLAKRLNRRVIVENDAAAAILAEHWVGEAKPFKDAMILTLGTGLGTGIIINNRLVRSGRELHPEAGHFILSAHDPLSLCGCGNYGCAEALLSGNGFARRASKKFFANQTLSGHEIAELARRKDRRALAAFAEYADHLSIAIHNYVVAFAPEIVVLTGSFAASAPYFLKETKRLLKKRLARRRIGIDLLPKIKVSSLQNQAGIIGAGYVALNARPKKPAGQ